MSRVYFHSPTRTAELRGSERAWLGTVAAGPARSAWRIGDLDLDRMADIIGLIPEVPDGAYGANYLHTTLREAQAEDARPGGPRTYEPIQKLCRALDTRLGSRHTEGSFAAAGHGLGISDVALNTALAAGSPPVQLAAKIDGWCESHAWVAGPNRAWLAGIIDEGLRAGIYRRGLWYADTPDGPKTNWSDQGWGDVTDLLRERDDEPVVMSYSVCASFPNRDVAAWEPAPLPVDWLPDWAMTDGYNEWTEMSDADRDYCRREAASDAWSDLPDEEKWRLSMEGLRDKPWLQLTPEWLGGVTFGPSVTVYDLLAPDRDERVRAAFADQAEAVAS